MYSQEFKDEVIKYAAENPHEPVYKIGLVFSISGATASGWIKGTQGNSRNPGRPRVEYPEEVRELAVSYARENPRASIASISRHLGIPYAKTREWCLEADVRKISRRNVPK